MYPWIRAVVCILFLFALCGPGFPQEAPGDQARAPEAPKEKNPFDEIVKDAARSPGLFTLYKTRKGDLFAEINPRQLDQPFLANITMETGLGDLFLQAGIPLNRGDLYFWHKVNNQLFLFKKNTSFTADPDRPIRRAVEKSFPDAIMGAAKLEAIHPERKSLLINLGGLLLTDIPGLAQRLTATLQAPYSLDKEKSHAGAFKAFPLNIEMDVELHYSTAKPPDLRLPTLADPRSIPLRVHYSFSALPEDGYRPRLVDDRVGYFMTARKDFSRDTGETPIVRYIHRWHIEKADPQLPLSPPKAPIVFWIENTTPMEYRDTVRDGILEWNKAYEKIGIKEAIHVKIQPDDAKWDPADIRYNTIRWITSSRPAFGGMGPSRVNPLTGQILDADILIEAETLRNVRRGYKYQIAPLETASEPPSSASDPAICTIARDGVQDAAIGALTMAARGDLIGDEAPLEYVCAYLRKTITHEVGHILGLRHNFRASTMLPLRDLHNRAITGKLGLAASIMEYLPTNISPRGVKQGQYFPASIGPYDYWAIEYGYLPISASTPEGERDELDAMARQAGTRPELAYATDEDARGADPSALDPMANLYDLSDDPLGFARQRLELARELWKRVPAKLPRRGESYYILRNAMNAAFSMYASTLEVPVKYVGGVVYKRMHAGDSARTPPFVPVSRKKQLEALDLLDQAVFREGPFRFSPDLLNKLAPDRLYDQFSTTEQLSLRVDFPLQEWVASIQRSTLDHLLHPRTLARMADNERRQSPKDTLSLPEYFEFLTNRIWSESLAGKPARGSFRRAVQQEYLKRLIKLLVAPAPGTPEDARALARSELVRLRHSLASSLSRHPANGKKDAEGQYGDAHYRNALSLADEALKAQLLRQLEPAPARTSR
ncbi:MAG: zinc-dependent metalloprotease [Armatimonadetes bacterium]|nr:zinc-dependent metalloprotease [Armatimonadota bacterium]